jgi:hypothetical protein
LRFLYYSFDLFCIFHRCDAEPIALARYVLALVAKDKPLDKLRENCIDRLEVFLDRGKNNLIFLELNLFFLFSNERFC